MNNELENPFVYEILGDTFAEFGSTEKATEFYLTSLAYKEDYDYNVKIYKKIANI